MKYIHVQYVRIKIHNMYFKKIILNKLMILYGNKENNIMKIL